MAWLWLIVRVWLGYSWLSSGYSKLTNPAWAGTGDALRTYWTNAVQTQPKAVIVYEWYRQFIQFMLDTHAYTWFAKLVVTGELLVGTLLILGASTGIAAFIGGFMNWNFMMAGSASTNPRLFRSLRSLDSCLENGGLLWTRPLAAPAARNTMEAEHYRAGP